MRLRFSRAQTKACSRRCSLIGILKSPVGSASYTTSQYSNDLGRQLANLDRALDNVSTVQATVGTRLRELESL